MSIDTQPNIPILAVGLANHPNALEQLSMPAFRAFL
jgi:hypothetical protein